MQKITKADEDTQEIIEELIANLMDALMIKLGGEIPLQLEYIIVETAIIRYNRLGSEGLKSEGIDVISQTFIEDVFAPYLSDISAYKATVIVDGSKSKLRMI